MAEFRYSQGRVALGSDAGIVLGARWQGTRYWIADARSAATVVLPKAHHQMDPVKHASKFVNGYLKRLRSALAVEACVPCRFGEPGPASSQTYFACSVEIADAGRYTPVRWGINANFRHHLERAFPEGRWLLVWSNYKAPLLVLVDGSRPTIRAFSMPVRRNLAVPA